MGRRRLAFSDRPCEANVPWRGATHAFNKRIFCAAVGRVAEAHARAAAESLWDMNPPTTDAATRVFLELDMASEWDRARADRSLYAPPRGGGVQHPGARPGGVTQGDDEHRQEADIKCHGGGRRLIHRDSPGGAGGAPEAGPRLLAQQRQRPLGKDYGRERGRHQRAERGDERQREPGGGRDHPGVCERARDSGRRAAAGVPESGAGGIL
ncbi:hypothetical protein EG872_15945 [Enterococcus faecalis]|nr:hypothetical protein EG872_15945 [Enterococcus faecalis]